MDDIPDDYDAPVFRSLTEPMLVLGVHRKAAIGLWGFAVMLLFSGAKFSNWWLLPIAAGLHVLLALLTARDPDFFRVVGQSLLSPKKLEP